jgi:tetratricopeptide (TPR) repeat protein
VAALVVLGAFVAVRSGRAPALQLLARRDLDRARALVASARPEEARTTLHRALQRQPPLVDARRGLAELELGAGRLEPAFLHFQAATEQEPADPRGWLGLARVRIGARQPSEAAAALDEALELDPSRSDARVMRAEVRLQLGRDQGALLDATEASRTRPSDARVWVALARATGRVKGAAAGAAVAEQAVAQVGRARALLEELSALRAGRVDRPEPAGRVRDPGGDHAERWPGALGATMRELVGKLRRQDWDGAERLAAAAGPAYPETLMGPWLEGVIEQARKRLDRAEGLFHEALALSPRSHRAITNLIGIWFAKKGHLHAADQLLALARADPGFVYPLPIAAREYLEADQPARAESTARLALTTLPGSPLPYREVASLYLELDRPGDALSLCEEGLARFPGDVRLQLLRVRGSLLLGDRERAIQQYEQLLPRWPDHPIVAAELAALLVESRSDAGSRERALALVRELELDGPMEPEVLGAMGRVYLQAGDPPRALAVLEPAARAAPDDPGLHYQLALARKAEGRPDLALPEVRRSLAVGHPFPGEADARRLLRELEGEQ